MGVMDLPGGRRTYAQEMEFLERVTPTQWRVREGFVPNMRVRRGVPSIRFIVMRRRQESGSWVVF